MTSSGGFFARLLGIKNTDEKYVDKKYKVGMNEWGATHDNPYLFTRGLGDCIAIGLIYQPDDASKPKPINLFHSASSHWDGSPTYRIFISTLENFIKNKVQDSKRLKIIINHGSAKTGVPLNKELDIDFKLIKAVVDSICATLGKQPIPDENYIFANSSASFYLNNRGEYGELIEDKKLKYYFAKPENNAFANTAKAGPQAR